MIISSDAVKAFDETQHPPRKNKLNKVDIEGICCQVASVLSNSVWPHGRQPTRLLRPWDSPGKNTGVGCHFLLQCMKVESESEVTQSCLTLSDPMDCSLPGPPSVGFSGQQYWSGVPLPSPRGDIPQHNKGHVWQMHSQHHTQWRKAESYLRWGKR